MKVLLLEVDREISASILAGLKELGHQVRLVVSGNDALTVLLSDAIDIAVLDRVLPDGDGLAVVRAARAAGCQAPILILTVMGAIADRVEGLEAGADDYLVKPFAFSELAARLGALARRLPYRPASGILTVRDIEMNLHRRTVKRGGRTIDLQPREFELLEHLMRSPDRIVTRTLLLERIWNFGFDPQTNIVETHMSRLRGKLDHGFDRSAIRTVRGSGYIMDMPDD